MLAVFDLKTEIVFDHIHERTVDMPRFGVDDWELTFCNMSFL